MNRASRSIPNYLIRLLPPLAMHNRLPYAIEVKVPTIKYEVRIEAGEKTNIYFLNLLKMHKICVEVFVATDCCIQFELFVANDCCTFNLSYL
jgi:hypothetical protein